MTRRTLPLGVLALAALFAGVPAPEAAAQCWGSARSATGSSGHADCSFLDSDVVPELSWSMTIQCIDECGEPFMTLPTMSEKATGDCTYLPVHVCIPFFDQRDHMSGLYAVSSARDQFVFGGCQLGTARWTDGSCPCALDCSDGSDEPPSEVFQQPGYGSPVLFSLGDGRFELTPVESGVIFDIDGNGTGERVAWTRPGGDEAFLALDRDGSGAIENGRELFGDGSPQLPSDEANGFRALALFDAPQNGGDGDGWIGPGDAIFVHLVLWRDLDHDGVSQPDELTSAAAAGLEGIDLGYRATGRRDRHGNQFRYASATRWRNGDQRPAWDVFFVVAPAEP